MCGRHLLAALACATLTSLLAGAGNCQPEAPEIPEDLAAMVRPGAQVQTVDTIAEMLASEMPDDEAHFVVRGYRTPGDDGGGLFRYQRLDIREPDGGTVFVAEGTPGRFVRDFDPTGDVHAEWFGAYGDGDSDAAHDDQAAINACLRKLNRVKLLAKTYGVRGKPTPYNPDATYNAIDLGPHYRVEGSGREETVLKLLDGSDPKGSAPGNNYFNLLGNRNFHESADYSEVRDLTIQCNFDGQNRHTTINAVGVRGGGFLMERCNIRGYGTGWHPEGSSRECFAIHQSLVFKDRAGCRRTAILRDLDFTGCGHNGDLEGHVGEITHIALGGSHNFENYSWIVPKGHDPEHDPANGGDNESNWWPGYGGLVENCYLHDEVVDPTQKSPLHGITYGDCIGLIVRNNRVENFEGAAVFTMSWWNRNVTVIDNEFINSGGIALHAKGTKGVPLQMPRHENTLVEGNRIELCRPVHNQYPPLGIQLYGQEPGTDIRFKNMIFRNNTISGRGYTAADGRAMVPGGIVFQVLGAIYDGIVFEDNTIDVPDYNPGVWVPQEAHSMSMTFFPLARWADDVKAGRVTYRNNTTPEGKPLRPILADWSYKNKPTYGETE